MPYIHTQTNGTITREGEQRLTRAFGEAVKLLGKNESWLMLRFEDGCRMAFRGESGGKICFIGVSMYGGASADALEKMTAALTRAAAEETGAAPECVYVRYLSTPDWGWNGSNF